VVFENTVEQDRDEHVIPYRCFTAMETGFQIAAHEVPRLMEDVPV
jgi:hypothetical protein